MAKKYIVDLSEDEISQLQTLIKTGKRKARIITRIRILLMASEAKTDKTIAEALRVHVSTVERTREEFVLGGLNFILSDRPHPPKPRKLDGRQEAFLAALYETFNPQEARRIRQKLEFHYTPKHASWLNQVEIELSVLSRQCLKARIGDRSTLELEIAAWEKQRNSLRASVNWRFKTTDARRKMERLYPTV